MCRHGPDEADGEKFPFLCRLYLSSASPYRIAIMRTTLTLDDDIYHAAMQLSQASGRTLGKVLSILVRRGLTQQIPEARGRS